MVSYTIEATKYCVNDDIMIQLWRTTYNEVASSVRDRARNNTWINIIEPWSSEWILEEDDIF